MSDYDNKDQLILKKVVSDNPKAPLYRAEITLGGVKYQAPLWWWTRKDGSDVLDKQGNRQFIGDIEVDNWKPEQQSAPQPVDDFEDSDLPF